MAWTEDIIQSKNLHLLSKYHIFKTPFETNARNIQVTVNLFCRVYIWVNNKMFVIYKSLIFVGRVWRGKRCYGVDSFWTRLNLWKEQPRLRKILTQFLISVSGEYGGSSV